MKKAVNPFVKEFAGEGVLKTPRVIDAFEKIDRADFVPPELGGDAYVNEPLPIGEGQTISQPFTVAFMVELLEPREGDIIFEIGFGSGWQTALLAHIVSQKGKSEIRSTKSETKGKIYAVERIKSLYEFGTKNIAKYNFIEKGIVKTIYGDATTGLKRYAPFDRIIAAASGKKVPAAWLKELKIGGRLVVPVKNSIWLYVKKSEKKFEKKEHQGFVFVSLVKKREMII